MLFDFLMALLSMSCHHPCALLALACMPFIIRVLSISITGSVKSTGFATTSRFMSEKRFQQEHVEEEEVKKARIFLNGCQNTQRVFATFKTSTYLISIADLLSYRMMKTPLLLRSSQPLSGNIIHYGTRGSTASAIMLLGVGGAVRHVHNGTLYTMGAYGLTTWKVSRVNMIRRSY